MSQVFRKTSIAKGEKKVAVIDPQISKPRPHPSRMFPGHNTQFSQTHTLFILLCIFRIFIVLRFPRILFPNISILKASFQGREKTQNGQWLILLLLFFFFESFQIENQLKNRVAS